jgi:hypothetical protein
MPQTTNLASANKTIAGKAGRTQLDPQFSDFSTLRHGKYASGALAGFCGRGANQTGVTTSVALAPTYVGVCLSNPAASGVNLILQKVNAIIDVAGTGPVPIGLITGFAAGGIVTHTTPIPPLNSVIGSSAAVLKGLLDAACTLVGTPAWARWLATNIATANLTSIDEDIDGEIVIPPGGYCAIGTLIASGASGFLGGMSWEEAPISATAGF